MAAKHGKVVTHNEGLLLLNSYNLLNMSSREVTRKNFLHYHNAYGHKSHQDGDMPQGAPTHKFAWRLNEKVIWSYVTN